MNDLIEQLKSRSKVKSKQVYNSMFLPNLRKLYFSLILFTFSYIVTAQNSKILFEKNTGINSDSYLSATFNGSWSWSSDPTTVYFESQHKRTYMSWIDNWGDIVVGFYDHNTNKIETHVVLENIDVDVNNSPSLFIDEKGYLVLSYKLNNLTNSTNYTLKATRPENISEWIKLEATNNKNEFITSKKWITKNSELIKSAIPSGIKTDLWDYAEDKGGFPIVVYVKYLNESSPEYCYSRWDGKKWNNYELVNSGGLFAKKQPDKEAKEQNYSGGMSIDKEDPNTLYLSVKRDSFFEIEKWVTANGGKTWKIEFITKGSSKDNVRPCAVRGAQNGNPVQVLWMQNTIYAHSHATLFTKWELRFHSSIKMDVTLPTVSNVLTKDGIEKLMRRVADWQLANPKRKQDKQDIHILDWHYAAFFIGLMDLYELTADERYIREMYNIGKRHDWKILDDIMHADRVAIIDMYERLYEKYKDPVILEKAKWAMDIIMSRGTTEKAMVHFKDNVYYDEWLTWCDALFMSPPVFARMTNISGNQKYANYMNAMWWKTSDYLYSNKDSLYYRDDRYIGKLSNNSKKIFWARGNGWVISGLARILKDLPKDSPYRPKFEQQYKEMAHKLLSLQLPDGLWTVSLLDPEYLRMGESSGSSFFTFALAYGLNNNLLEAKYRPQVEKAWKTLSANVNQYGRLGYVQQVAGDPYPFKEDEFHVYASGAYLMAGKEMIKMLFPN